MQNCCREFRTCRGDVIMRKKKKHGIYLIKEMDKISVKEKLNSKETFSTPRLRALSVE